MDASSALPVSIFLAGFLVALSLALGLRAIATALTLLAARIDMMNTHGLHVRGYPDSPIEVRTGDPRSRA